MEKTFFYLLIVLLVSMPACVNDAPGIHKQNLGVSDYYKFSKADFNDHVSNLGGLNLHPDKLYLVNRFMFDCYLIHGGKSDTLNFSLEPLDTVYGDSSIFGYTWALPRYGINRQEWFRGLTGDNPVVLISDLDQNSVRFIADSATVDSFRVHCARMSPELGIRIETEGYIVNLCSEYTFVGSVGGKTFYYSHPVRIDRLLGYLQNGYNENRGYLVASQEAHSRLGDEDDIIIELGEGVLGVVRSGYVTELRSKSSNERIFFTDNKETSLRGYTDNGTPIRVYCIDTGVYLTSEGVLASMKMPTELMQKTKPWIWQVAGGKVLLKKN